MAFVAFLLAGLLGFGAAVEGPAPAVSGEVFPLDFPDPMVIRAGDVYYAYGTQTPWEEHGIFPVLRSTDLRHWTYVADALPGRPAWARGDVWAPSVLEHGGTYYLYYSATKLDGDPDHCLAVATASSPTGPFQDRGPIACGDGAVHGYIDAMPLVDETGAYLYFSVDYPYHSISMLPLTPDLLHAAGPRVELLGVTQPWEHGAEYTTVEGPFVIREQGLYYLFYSGNDWKHDYAMGFATGPTAAGPFTKSNANPVLSGGLDHGPGGGSLFRADGRWMLAYHAWGTRGRTLHMASICLDAGALRVNC